MAELRPQIGPLNVIVHEKGNKYVAMRAIKWTPTSEYKVDIRNYALNSDGDEVMLKGISLSDDAADNLTNELIRAGYGNTREIKEMIEAREDYNQEDDYDNTEAISSFIDIRKEIMG